MGEVGGGPGAGAGPGSEAVAQSRMVTVKPDKGALMMCLFGLDALTAVGSASAATAGGGPGAGESIKQTGAMALVNAVLGYFRKMLGLDVLSVRKSELAARRQRQSPGSTAPAAGASRFEGTVMSFSLPTDDPAIRAELDRGLAPILAGRASRGFVTLRRLRSS